MAGPINVTYSDLSPELVYKGSWSADAWNAPNAGLNGTVHVTTDATASVIFTFPLPAVEFYYFGFGRSTGALYTICIDDCSTFSVINGFNATDDGNNPPAVLYQKSFATPGIHRIVLTNTVDPRGTPLGSSQLCVASFVLTTLMDGGPLIINSTTPFPSASSIPLHPSLPSTVPSNQAASTVLSSTVLDPGKTTGTAGPQPDMSPPPVGTTSFVGSSASATAAAHLSPEQRRLASPAIAAAVIAACSALCIILIGFVLVRRWRRRRLMSARRANASTYTSPMAYRPWGPIPSLPATGNINDRKIRLIGVADSAGRITQSKSALVASQTRERALPDTPRVARVAPTRRHSGRSRAGRRRNVGLRSVAGQQLASIAETQPPEYMSAL